MDQSRFIAKHVVNLPKSGIRDFFDIVAKMKDAISLGVGEPDFDTPWHIREAGIYALEKGKTHYTSNLGLIELRRAINKYVEKNYRRQLRAGERDHHHRRRQRGARPRLPRAHQSRRQGDVSPAVLRQLFTRASRSRMASPCPCRRSRRTASRSPWTRSAPRGSRVAKC